MVESSSGSPIDGEAAPSSASERSDLELSPSTDDADAVAHPRLAAKLAEPIRDRSDELLEAPPRGEHHLGRFAGYRAGTGIRRVIAGVALVAGIAVVALFVRQQRYVAQQEYESKHPWSLPEGSDLDSRPRTIVWSGGAARLALSREPPGALRIQLPDRIIELAEDCDDAQVRFVIEDGRTTKFQVLSGEVVQLPRP